MNDRSKYEKISHLFFTPNLTRRKTSSYRRGGKLNKFARRILDKISQSKLVYAHNSWPLTKVLRLSRRIT